MNIFFLLTKSSKYFWDQEGVREEKGKLDRRLRSSTFKKVQKIGYALCSSEYVETNGRNLLTVWTIPTESFSEAHFATYPQKLVETCIKAGTPEWGCCPECGKAWVRVVERSIMEFKPSDRDKKMGCPPNKRHTSGTMTKAPTSKTIGFQPSCSCPPAEPIPCTVLDPFLGSGTTALVAQKMGRRWIGIELNPEYTAMAKKRIGTNLFAEKVDAKCLQL